MQANQSAAKTQSQPARTALYDLHVELGARLVSFAGFAMPLNYPSGILTEHRHTRSQASLFDVSHMSRFRIQGTDAMLALESVCPADLDALAPDRLRYSVLTNDTGGVIDDIIIRRAGTDFEIIANAANRSSDEQWLDERIGRQCQINLDEHFALLALQGPAAAQVLRDLNPGVDELVFMQAAHLPLANIDCLVARAGYTGEDGFEISVPIAAADKLARRLLADSAVQPAGLGARDSLRLEAGLSLHGQELGPTISPVEAGLGWTIAKTRRETGARAGGFPGSECILRELRLGPARRLRGLLPDGRAPVRAGTPLVDDHDRPIGHVSSGGHSPTLERPIGLGFIETPELDRDTPVFAEVRGRRVAVALTRPPFIPHRYKHSHS